jgi:hypothetical protein
MAYFRSPDSGLDHVLGSRTIVEAHRRAEEVFKTTERIKPEDFSRYDKAIIAEDLEYVRRHKALFEAEDSADSRESKMLADVLEAIVYEQVELSEWLGENVCTVRASEFDDIKNGCDAIAEFTDAQAVSHLALAIDVTYSQKVLDRKLDRVLQEISLGTLTEIKYFKSPDGTFEGSLTKVPRVLIAVDKEHVLQLAQLWLKKKNKELSMHPIQILILNEIARQLEVFIAYARRAKQEQLVPIFERRLNFVRSALRGDTKRLLAGKDETKEYLNEDRVYSELTRKLETL